jgi:hypothetical protein
MPPSSMNDLFAFVTQLMTEHAGLFETVGQHMFRGLAVIMIAWFGIKVALGSVSSGHGSALHLDQFASLLLTIAFGFAMITYYSQPLPGMSQSFYHLIIDEGLDLSNQLNHGMAQEIWNRFTNLYWGMETPGLTLTLNLMEIVRYTVTVAALLIAQASVLAIIAFGYVAAAITVMVGPIFIPFFIVPGLEWLFWGWLKALVQYAFYPVVANAYVFVFGSLMIHLIDSHPPPYDGVAVAKLFFPLVLMIVSFTFGIVKIPSLVNSIFAGRSGEWVPPPL